MANEIRKAEDSEWSPEQLATDLNAVALVLPEVAPYLSGAELAYAGIVESGKVMQPQIERLAVRYDL